MITQSTWRYLWDLFVTLIWLFHRALEGSWKHCSMFPPMILVVTRCCCWAKLSKCWNWRNLIAENITDLHRVGTGIVIVISISKMVKRLIIMIFKVMMTIPGNVTGSCRGRRHWAGEQTSASQPEDYSWWWGMALFCKLNANYFCTIRF